MKQHLWGAQKDEGSIMQRTTFTWYGKWRVMFDLCPVYNDTDKEFLWYLKGYYAE